MSVVMLVQTRFATGTCVAVVEPWESQGYTGIHAAVTRLEPRSHGINSLPCVMLHYPALCRIILLTLHYLAISFNVLHWENVCLARAKRMPSALALD